MTAGHQHWSAGRTTFRRFLEWLDEGRGSGGQSYTEIRRRLVSYLDRKNCPTPDELDDETLDRVARRLDEEGAITNASRGAYRFRVVIK